MLSLSLLLFSSHCDNSVTTIPQTFYNLPHHPHWKELQGSTKPAWQTVHLGSPARGRTLGLEIGHYCKFWSGHFPATSQPQTYTNGEPRSPASSWNLRITPTFTLGGGGSTLTFGDWNFGHRYLSIYLELIFEVVTKLDPWIVLYLLV